MKNMLMKFCPRCKALLIPQKIDDKFFLKCDACNFLKKLKEEEFLVIKNKITRPELKGKGVLKDENVLATYEHKCKKCGHNKAQVLDLGIFYSDEDNLIMLQCGKCGYSERIGRNTS